VQTKSWELDFAWKTSFVRLQMHPVEMVINSALTGLVKPTPKALQDMTDYGKAWAQLIAEEKKRQFAAGLTDFTKVIYDFWQVTSWYLMPMVIWVKVRPT
jgi:hypothetical protein